MSSGRINCPDLELMMMPLGQESSVSVAPLRQEGARLAGNRAAERVTCNAGTSVRVCLLTGGDDRPYALGMASALVAQGIATDFIGSDKLDAPELHRSSLLTFLNLRGDQSEEAPLRRKVARILSTTRVWRCTPHGRGRGSFISSGITNSSTSIERC